MKSRSRPVAYAFRLPIIALLIAAGAATLAQAPAPATGNLPAQQNTADQQPPNSTPKPAQGTPAASSGEAQGQGPSVAWWTTLFTGFLVAVAVIQAIMFWWQLQVLKKSLQDSKDMSKAAKDAAEAARASADIGQKMERALITAEVTPASLALGSTERVWTEDDMTEVTANVTLRNHGRTPAIIRRIHIQLVVAFSAPANPQAFLAGPQRDLPPALAIAPSGSYETVVRRTLPRLLWQEAVSGKKTLFCGGRIEYDDVLGQRHETLCCWERSESDGADRYAITYSAALNYFGFNSTDPASD